MLIKKITAFFSKKHKSEGTGSAFSQNLQKSRYKASHLASGQRKKGFLERWSFSRRKRGAQGNGVFSKKEQGQFSFLLKLALLSGAVLTGSYVLLMGPMQSLYGNWRYFRIHEIEISGCRTISSDDLKKYAGLSYEMNMLTLDPKAISVRLSSHPWVKSATVKRVWPDSLEVSVREHRPRALVVCGIEKNFSYVNNGASVFVQVHPGQELDYPVITGIEPTVTEQEKQRMLKAANLFLKLAEQNNPNLPAQNISEVHFTNKGDMVLYLVEHPFPIYFGKDEIKRKFSQLWRVLEVLYHKRKGKAKIEDVAYIRMDYQTNKVLVATNHAG